MKTYLLAIAMAACCLAGAAHAQDEAFIYGKITTAEKQVYEGPIRWGKEEVYWMDVFNASKLENENLRFLSAEQKEKLSENGWEGLHWNSNGLCITPLRHFSGKGRHYQYPCDRDFTHQFSCRFGEIKSLRPRSSRTVEVELQGGLKFEVNGEGYNDIGASLTVLDKEIGEIELNWNRVAMVEFSATPAKLPRTFGEPLVGTVQTYGGSFTGFIQWDHDERLSEDKLDGHTDDGKVSLRFGNIQSVERISGRSRVVLKSGREMELSGTNDVNTENRGIIVTDENGLMVDVPWSEFKKLTLENKALKGPRYADFKTQNPLSATVKTKDKTLTGTTVIDLDEAYDFELFQGKDGEVEYTVPLRNVKSIETKSPKSVELTLKTGKKLTLRESQDAGLANQGVLIFEAKNEPAYIPWSEVNHIEMK